MLPFRTTFFPRYSTNYPVSYQRHGLFGDLWHICDQSARIGGGGGKHQDG